KKNKKGKIRKKKIKRKKMNKNEKKRKKILEEAPANEQAKGNELNDKLSLVELDGYKSELTIIVTLSDKCMVTLDLFCKGHLLSGRDGGAMDDD
ncbi:hypothetical protein RFI_39033, partial [Reticulomyxa filosa]